MPEIRTFEELIYHYTNLYIEQKYQDVFDLVTAEMAKFPAHLGESICVQAAMLSRLGDCSGALEKLHEGLDAGYWYADRALVNDEDFIPLRDNPDFNAIVAECRERQQQAVATVKPSRIVLEPKTQNYPMPLLIALHGNFSHAAGFASHWQPAADQGWLVAVPQSTQFGWANSNGVWTDNDRAIAEVQQHYQELIEQYPVDTSRVVLAGFSMGGQVAMKMALSGTIPALGFIGVEGWIFGVENLLPLLDNIVNSAVRNYLITGANPQFADEGKAVFELLKERGLICKLEQTANLYHDVSPDFPEVLNRALTFICSS